MNCNNDFYDIYTNVLIDTLYPCIYEGIEGLFIHASELYNKKK